MAIGANTGAKNSVYGPATMKTADPTSVTRFIISKNCTTLRAVPAAAPAPPATPPVPAVGEATIDVAIKFLLAIS